MNIIKDDEDPKIKSFLERLDASRFSENTFSSPQDFLKEICDPVLHHEMSKHAKERDNQFVSILSRSTLPQLPLNEMKDEYKIKAKNIIEERRRSKNIKVWNPLALLEDASSEQIYESTMIVEELKTLSLADPEQCTMLLRWVKDEVDKLDFAKTSKIKQFDWCLHQMRNIVQMMRGVSDFMHKQI